MSTMKQGIGALMGLMLLTPTVVGATPDTATRDTVATKVPAFPGAEGFGRYTTGGRGGKVYHVTTLEDSTTPTSGMLRYALNQKGARTIVFDVAGTIRLKSSLDIRNGDLTIAGQSAPGDGICLADYPVTIKASNVIMRYLRFRLGNYEVANHEGDGLGAMDQNDLMIDHCTISWSVDECCSVYGGKNITVQWCIISQSMKNSGHAKGAHGYGGNWGGSGCTYAHNLLCHHDSRTPRLGPRPGTQTDERLDMRNNVIYNWAGNGCYGGEGMNVNIVNNYYKPGPATAKRSSTIQRRIAAPGIRTTSYCQNSDGSWNSWYAMWHVWGDYYVDGNVNSKYSDVTQDNWTYGVYNQVTNGSGVDNTYTQATKDTLRVDNPLPFPSTTTFTAEEAYEKVLNYAGCIKVRSGQLVRDRLDSLMVTDTRTGVATYGTNGIIDTQDDVIDDAHPDPWPTLTATNAEITNQSVDSNKDGIPDNYDDLYGFSETGDKYELSAEYTNLEVYLNRLVQKITTECTTGGEVLGDEVGYYVPGGSTAIDITTADRNATRRTTTVYTLSGVPVCTYNAGAEQVPACLTPGVYIVGGRKVVVGR